MTKGFEIKIFGARGSYPTPAINKTFYSGNTSCVLVKVGGKTIILDAGTGIKNINSKEIISNDILLLLSHCHWDHIQGFPFFPLLFSKEISLDIRAGNLSYFKGGIEKVLTSQMTEPFFPVPINFFQSKKKFTNFKPGKTITLDQIVIKTLALNHPGGATGYRIEHGGKSACYITDHEHYLDKENEALNDFVEGSDLMIYDSAYDDNNFSKYIGWGHSTWQEAIRLSKRSNVQNLLLFHHDPLNDDAKLKSIEQQAKTHFKNVHLAKEGMKLKLV